MVRRHVEADARLSRQVSDYDDEERRLNDRLGKIDSDVTELWRQQQLNDWPMAFVTLGLNRLNADRQAALDALRRLRTSRAASLVDQDESARVIAELASIRATLSEELEVEHKRHVVRLLVAGGSVETVRIDDRVGGILELQLRWGELVRLSGKEPYYCYYGNHPDTTIPC